MKSPLKTFGGMSVVAATLMLGGCLESSKGGNSAPDAISTSFITQTEVAISDTLEAEDSEGGVLTFSLGDIEPSLGSVVVSSNGDFVYQPFTGVTGSDSFSFSVSDQAGLTASGSVRITIENLQVSFLELSRNAFGAEPTDAPLTLNGRDFTQDVVNQNDYQDLIDAN